MIFKQILYLVYFTFWVISYSQLILVPSFVINNKNTAKKIKEDAQQLSTRMLSSAFNANFYLAKTEQNINELINENKELIDIVVCNHVSTIDFLLVLNCLKKFNVSCSPIIKKPIKYIPGYGFVCHMDNDIVLSRNWERDQRTLGEQINKIHIGNKKQVILIFPEGTRITSAKLKEGQEYSQKNNLPVFNNLLVPRTKGLWYIINHLQESQKLGRIWDMSLAIPKFMGNSAYISDLLGGSLGNIFCIIRELKIKHDKDTVNFKNIFLKSWKEKDTMLKDYHKFIYDKVDSTNNISNSILLTVFSLAILFSKSGRHYYILTLIVSYMIVTLDIKLHS